MTRLKTISELIILVLLFMLWSQVPLLGQSSRFESPFLNTDGSLAVGKVIYIINESTGDSIRMNEITGKAGFYRSNTDNVPYGTFRVRVDGTLSTQKIWIGSSRIRSLIEGVDPDANNQIDTGGIESGAVTSDKISPSAITAGKLATGSVSAINMGLNSVDGSNIIDNSITTADLVDSQVTRSKLSTTVNILLDAPGSGAIYSPDDESIKFKIVAGPDTLLSVDSLWLDNQGMRAVRDSIFRKVDVGKMADREWINRLSIPTPDGIDSLTHPSVQFRAGGWNGYRYWMAFTPYPDAARENPCIVVSNDGVEWQIPPGGSNPVGPLSEAVSDGFSAQSDPDIIFVGDTLYLYYRMQNTTVGLEKNAIKLKKSADGITWGARQSVLIDNSTVLTQLSPSVLYTNGQFEMWTVEDTATVLSKRVFRRTSPDGLTFDPAAACTITSIDPSTSIWHIDVIQARNLYYMIAVANSPTYRLHLYSSGDGVSWSELDVDFELFNGPDAGGNYRSTFIALPGNPVKFRIWAVGILTPSQIFTSKHSILLYDDFEINHQSLSTIQGNTVDKIFIPADEFQTAGGSPTLGTINSRWRVMQFDEGVTEGIFFNYWFPAGWDKVGASLIWVNPTDSTGDVKWQFAAQYTAIGASLSGGGTNWATTVTAGSANTLTKTLLRTTVGTETNADGINHIRLYRLDDPADTVNEHVSVLGILLEKVYQ